MPSEKGTVGWALLLKQLQTINMKGTSFEEQGGWFCTAGEVHGCIQITSIPWPSLVASLRSDWIQEKLKQN